MPIPIVERPVGVTVMAVVELLLAAAFAIGGVWFLADFSTTAPIRTPDYMAGAAIFTFALLVTAMALYFHANASLRGRCWAWTTSAVAGWILLGAAVLMILTGLASYAIAEGGEDLDDRRFTLIMSLLIALPTM